ncbi:MAG: hypothetical protein JKY66_04935 [Spongiibacteraceae bacterium]|nr:hypothetical protein [Spongiibacteraceae bacterium]
MLSKKNKELEATVRQYQKSIYQLELDGGAYAPRLWEKIQGLALAYYRQGKHKEATAVFKRALHVYRVNNGLYNVEQVPLLKQMIDNHIALKDFSVADDLHYYLYRTRLHNVQDDEPGMVEALREYALWQREAYFLKVGKNIHRRLMSMHDLQTQALDIIERTEGGSNEKKLPLFGDLLTTQYLLASYVAQPESDSSKMQYDRLKFDYLRLSSYSKGIDILSRTIAIHDSSAHASVDDKANAVVALGDWHQWHNKHTQALGVYTQAYHLLAQSKDGAEQLKATFSSPQALPAKGIFSSKLAEPKGKKKGYVTAQFSVTDDGAAKKISFLDSDEQAETEQYTRNQWKIKSSISKMLFRPRFENAQPVRTEGVVQRYEFYY